MIILTPKAKYEFIARDNSPNGDDKAVVKETWVEDVYQLHRGLLDDTGIFIDIGANIGAVSVFAAALEDDDPEGADPKKYPKINIYAVEPEPHNVELLRKNIELNKKPNITVIEKAIWSSRTTLELEDNAGGSMLKAIGGKDKNTSEVEAIRLVDLFADNKIANCDVLKMDVEGAEYEIINTADEDVLKKIKHLRMEFHPTDAVKFGLMIYKLARLFNLHIIGTPSVGGNIYGDRY